MDDHLSRPTVAGGLKRLPGRVAGDHILRPYQSCTRWGLQSGRVARPLVSSYLTFPPLPISPKRERRYISVALSLESPPPGVTRHPALWSSDFPHALSARPKPSAAPAAVRRPHNASKWVIVLPRAHTGCAHNCRNTRPFRRPLPRAARRLAGSCSSRRTGPQGASPSAACCAA